LKEKESQESKMGNHRAAARCWQEVKLFARTSASERQSTSSSR
jgi:hypothetical protein